MTKKLKRKIKKADAIFTGDWHLQDKQPICRTDDFWETQWRKVQFISELQKKHECLVLHSGDLFDHWKPSPMILARTIKELPFNFYTIYGNHDLPKHNLALVYKCGINVLREAGILGVLRQTHWTQTPAIKKALPVKDKKILVIHTMTYKGKEPWPRCTDPKASKLLKTYPEYDLILSGHNHKTFVEDYKGRLLVNPGSIFRLTTAQQTHNPCVFLWYAKTNTVKPVYLPIEHNVISREHIERKEENNKKMQAFIENLNTDWEVEMSLQENIKKFLSINQVSKDIVDIITEAIE